MVTKNTVQVWWKGRKLSLCNPNRLKPCIIGTMSHLAWMKDSFVLRSELAALRVPRSDRISFFRKNRK